MPPRERGEATKSISQKLQSSLPEQRQQEQLESGSVQKDLNNFLNTCDILPHDSNADKDTQQLKVELAEARRKIDRLEEEKSEYKRLYFKYFDEYLKYFHMNQESVEKINLLSSTIPPAFKGVVEHKATQTKPNAARKSFSKCFLLD